MELGISPSWCRNARYHGRVVPYSQVEAVMLPWQQNCIMVCGCHCLPDLFGGEGDIINSSLMARQEQILLPRSTKSKRI